MIVTTRDGAVATITIDRADARNAISLAGWDALAAQARALADSDTDVVVIRSATRVFSAGADLADLASLISDVAGRTRFRTAMAAAIEAVAALPMLVIAAIDGGCHGAAVALTLACDIRIAGDHASFEIPPARLGIGYPGADVARLIALVGRGQAARLLLTAEAIDADTAQQIGLVELRAADAGARAAALAATIAGHSRSALRLLKTTLGDPGDSDLDAAFEAAFGGPDFAERLARFRVRRR